MATVQERLQSIIDKANTTTGKADTDVTAATQSLIDGFGGGDNPLEYAAGLDFAFSNVQFPPNYSLVLNVPRIKSLGSLISNSKGIVKLALQTTPGTEVNANRMATSSKDLQTLDLTEFGRKFTQFESALQFCQNLKVILGKIDLTPNANITSAFGSCEELEQVQFVKSCIGSRLELWSSGKLNETSIRSVVAGLSDTASSQALLLAKVAVDNNFPGGSTGQEWLDLVATKPNWTITLQ